MKKITLLTILLISFDHFLCAQQIIAKLKFEEAEEAYTLNNFELTLSKLEEAKTLLGSTNPKIMHLQIVSQSKIIERNPLNDFYLIESTRNLCGKYLTDYDNLPDNEDKYKDIYKISERFKLYPATIIDFETRKRQMELDAEARKQDEADRRYKIESAKLEKRNKIIHFVDSLCYSFKFKNGLTEEEFRQYNPEAALMMKERWKESYDSYYNYKKWGSGRGIMNVSVREGKVFKCHYEMDVKVKNANVAYLSYRKLLIDNLADIKFTDSSNYPGTNKFTIRVVDSNIMIELDYSGALYIEFTTIF